MKKSIVLIDKNILTYKGCTYDYQSFYEYIKLSKKRLIIILDEDIYVKKVIINSNKILNEDIDKLKEEAFGKDEEYLVDYKIRQKEEILYIYAIKGGGKVSKLCYGADNMQVVPLQFYVMKKLKKRIKDKSYNCVFKYKDTYYYYLYVDGFIEESFTFKDVEVLMKKIGIKKRQYTVHIQKGIGDLNIKDWDETRELELKGILNERTFV